MKEIPLTQGKFAIIDDEDYNEINKYKWYYNYGYAVRAVRLGDGGKNTLGMHVAIIGRVKELEIDHINGNRLDNRRMNLRHATRAQNQQNRMPSDNCSSRYKGVFWHKRDKKWMARIVIENKRYCLGGYKSEHDAAYVYNVWAESFFGEYARVNEINITIPYEVNIK